MKVGSLLDRYLLDLDDDGVALDDAWARSLFTEDAGVEFPMGGHQGRAGLADYHRRTLSAWERTQHIHSPAVVELLEGRAVLRANLMSVLVHKADDSAPPIFVTGTFVSGEARLTPDGWRLSRLSFRLGWTAGRPPAAPGAAD